MSEYQYYEFQAVDRPLTPSEQAELRNYSSRATITASRFAVEYDWGSFKGNASEWMDEYFDAFLYFANWGDHELMLRLPRAALPLETARRYCAGQRAWARAKGDHVILELHNVDDEPEDGVDEHPSLAPLLPLRDELASGDLRTLYVAWLAGAHELDDDDEEPPCPPGLRDPSAALEELVDFLAVDRDLVEAAAAASPDLAPADPAALERWIAALPAAEKTSMLVRLAGGGEMYVRAELLRRFREARVRESAHAPTKPRTVGELRAAAEACAHARRRREAAQAAHEEARCRREAAEARERHLGDLARREAEAWREVEAIAAGKVARRYYHAAALLRDLREVCARAGREAEAAARIARLRDEHARMPRFIERMREAGLIG